MRFGFCMIGENPLFFPPMEDVDSTDPVDPMDLVVVVVVVVVEHGVGFFLYTGDRFMSDLVGGEDVVEENTLVVMVVE